MARGNSDELTAAQVDAVLDAVDDAIVDLAADFYWTDGLTRRVHDILRERGVEVDAPL